MMAEFAVCEPRVNDGFGYDPLFEVTGRGRTMAELSSRGKDALSHRGAAARAMKKELPRWLELRG